jgi:hypothetical protein
LVVHYTFPRPCLQMYDVIWFSICDIEWENDYRNVFKFIKRKGLSKIILIL